MVENGEKTIPAAYLPFKTFISALDSLGDGLPRKLDRTIWRSQSGIVQGQIMMALRFFSLINSNDEPTQALQVMVEKPADRPQQIAALLRHAYRDVLEHDLTKMTPKMLDDAMGNYGVQGDTRRKAIAFFLRAAKYCELPMHPLLMAQTRNSSGGFRRKRRVKEAPEPEPNGMPVGIPQNIGNSVTKAVSLPSGTKISLQISTANWLDLPPAEREFVFGLVDFLQNHPNGIGDDEEEED
jgi:hypothetical protein